MIGYWISFWLILVFIIFGFPFGLYSSRKYIKKDKLPELNRTVVANLIKSMFLYILGDLLYMSIFIDNLPCKFVFGCLILVLIYSNLGYAFSSPSKKNKLARFGLIQDFIIGSALTVYLIFIIPNKELQGVVIPVVSAIYGGLITLTGVAWTIRRSDELRKKDEIKELKPLVFISNRTIIKKDSKPNTYWIVDNKNKGDLKVGESGLGSYKFCDFQLANSDYSYCTFRGFCLNNSKYHWFDCGQALDKGQTAIFSLGQYFIFHEEIEEVFLLFEDMIGNIYIMNVDFSINDYDANGTKAINIISGHTPELVEFEFGEELNGE